MCASNKNAQMAPYSAVHAHKNTHTDTQSSNRMAPEEARNAPRRFSCEMTGINHLSLSPW